MAFTSMDEWSESSAAANTELNGIGLNNSMTPTQLPTTFREMMKQVKAGTYGTRANSGLLHGLALSNNTGDANNDIDIASGIAMDATAASYMRLSSGITKRLDASWAVGTNQGGLDTGSIADTTYHVHLIKRSDTGVVDALFSTSATSPTMPANYDYARRIGSVRRISGAIQAFLQVGDNFYIAPIVDYTTLTARAIALLTISVPSGIVVVPMLTLRFQQGTVGAVTISLAPGANSALAYTALQTNLNLDRVTVEEIGPPTNTSAQIYLGVTIDSGDLNDVDLFTHGWIDARGRL